MTTLLPPALRTARELVEPTLRSAVALDAKDVAAQRSLGEALTDEQTLVNRMIVDAGTTSAGPVRLIGSPIDMSAAPLRVRHAPPRLGRVTGTFLANILEGGPADVPHPRLIERYLKSSMPRGDEYVDYRAAMIRLLEQQP